MKLEKLREIAKDDNLFRFHDAMRTHIDALLDVVEAAKSVIEFVNPMFTKTDECLIALKAALAKLEAVK